MGKTNLKRTENGNEEQPHEIKKKKIKLNWQKIKF